MLIPLDCEGVLQFATEFLKQAYRPVFKLRICYDNIDSECNSPLTQWFQTAKTLSGGLGPCKTPKTLILFNFVVGIV